MIFDTAIEKAIAEKDKTVTSIVKLGTVTSVTGGRAKIKHYGESVSSDKEYTFIDGYFPEVGDKVAMLPQANTYIIIGKLMDEAPVEKYATIEYVDETFLPLEYKNKLEDDNDETLTFTGNALVPGTDNTDDLGTLSKYFKNLYIKKLILNGTEYTEISTDRIEIKSGGTTYSLIATVASGIISLLPSTNDSWKLGSSAYHLKEAWLGLFRGAWKSGQATERQLSWNSSNALVPDADNTVDLGSASYQFARLFLTALIGAKWQYQSGSANSLAWSSATDILPNNTEVVNLGSTTKQLSAVYAKKFYLNGTEIDISGITLDKLTTKYSNTNYTLTLSVVSGGTSNQYEKLEPSVHAKFDLGSSSYRFRNIYGVTIYGELSGGIKDGNQNIEFDSAHNFVPSTTNYISLGTSSKQYKNVYGQNIYVNGTAVSSDRRKKEDISPLDWRYEEFFKHLNPVAFKYTDGTSGRKHTGFIAQEVEEAVQKAGLSDKELAVVVRDQDDSYYLRYEELIAIQTEVIKSLMAKVETLESDNKQIKKKINKLESRLEKVERFLFED